MRHKLCLHIVFQLLVLSLLLRQQEAVWKTEGDNVLDKSLAFPSQLSPLIPLVIVTAASRCSRPLGDVCRYASTVARLLKQQKTITHLCDNGSNSSRYVLWMLFYAAGLTGHSTLSPQTTAPCQVRLDKCGTSDVLKAKDSVC